MKPADLHAMGYNIVIYGITLLMRITRTMQLALEDLRSERLELVGSGVSFQEYMRIVDLDRWSAIETRRARNRPWAEKPWSTSSPSFMRLSAPGTPPRGAACSSAPVASATPTWATTAPGPPASWPLRGCAIPHHTRS